MHFPVQGPHNEHVARRHVDAGAWRPEETVAAPGGGGRQERREDPQPAHCARNAPLAHALG